MATRTMFTGVGTALVTPFTKTGALDEGAVKRLARRQIDAGIHFLVPCGTTGETPTLTAAERRRVVELVLEEANGKVPVMAGAGANDTKDAVELSKEMQSIGVQGLLQVTPYYNKPTPEGLFAHFSAIAEATTLPVLLYNVPGRTGCNIDAVTLAKLAAIPHVIGVSGDDAMTLPLMAIGGRGLISVATNSLPAEMVQVVEAAERGDYATARRLHQRLVPIMLGNFIESNPGPVKYAMAVMGLLEEAYRLPMVPMRQASKDKMDGWLRELGPEAGRV
jgi:4-hydroxy-tetrahydrodipicolinate synthase